MATEHAPDTPSRDEEIRLIWTHNQWLYIVVGFMAGLLFFPLLQLVIADVSGLLSNLVPEAVGIGVTVLLIDRLNRLRDERNAERALKEQLLRNIRSTSNEVAIDAVHQLREYKWLVGEKGLLKGQRLRGANLKNASLEFANLQGVKLGFANLQEANLECASLRGANLGSTNLWGTDFTNADLIEVNLWGANLAGASLRSADLTSANLQAAILEEGIIKAQFDETTILPDGTHWTPETNMRRFTHPEEYPGGETDSTPE
jgi:hypothetical protein